MKLPQYQNSVVFADRSGGFVRGILSYVCNSRMQVTNLGLNFLPIPAKLFPALQSTLIESDALFFPRYVDGLIDMTV